MSNISLIETHASDFDEYYRIRCSPADIYWNGYLHEPDRESFRRLFLARTAAAPFEKPEDRHIYLIQLLLDGGVPTYIGFIQLIRRVGAVEIGYTVIEEYQGNGYATQALQMAIVYAKRYMDRIIVRIRDDNIASQRVAEKSGFARSNRYVEKEYPSAGIVKLREYVYSPN